MALSFRKQLKIELTGYNENGNEVTENIIVFEFTPMQIANLLPLQEKIQTSFNDAKEQVEEKQKKALEQITKIDELVAKKELNKKQGESQKQAVNNAFVAEIESINAKNISKIIYENKQELQDILIECTSLKEEIMEVGGSTLIDIFKAIFEVNNDFLSKMGTVNQSQEVQESQNKKTQ